MPQAATIKSIPGAFRMMKAMQAQGIDWGEDYRRAGAHALKEVLEGHPNDRLLLGMKGSISEFELGVLRARMLDSARAKARRGELRISDLHP